MPGAVREAARILRDGCRFCVCVTHPMRDAGGYEAHDPQAPFAIHGSYFGKREFGPVTVRRGGHEVSFAGWAYALEEYARAFEAAGLLIEAMREPPDRVRDLPNFLLIRTVKDTRENG